MPTQQSIFDEQEEQQEVGPIRSLFQRRDDSTPSQPPSIFDQPTNGQGRQRSLFDEAPAEGDQRVGRDGVEPIERESLFRGGPLDFSRRAIGTPWTTGSQIGGTAIADALEFYADMRERTPAVMPHDLIRKGIDLSLQMVSPDTPGIQDVERAAFDALASHLRDYSNSFKTSPRRIPEPRSRGIMDLVRNPTHIIDYLEPNRLYATMAEGIPLTASILLAYRANPVGGALMMVGVEGGSVNAMMNHYEEETGEEIDPTYRVLAPILIGSFNAALERFAISRIINKGKAMGNTGIRGKLWAAADAAASNALITGTQAVTVAASEVGYTGEIPEGLDEAFVEGFYSGGVLGGALSGATGALHSIRHRSPNDIRIDGWETGEDGRLRPRFAVQKGGHPLEGTNITLEEAELQNDLNLPLWRFERLKEEIRQSPVEFQHPEAVEHAMGVLLKARASKMGYDNVDQMIAELNFRVDPNGTIHMADLLQAEVLHGSPHDFDRFSTDHMGTGEGFQAFGWGLYFTESMGIAKDYARSLGQSTVSIKGVTLNTLQSIRDAIIEPSESLRKKFSELDSFTQDMAVANIESSINEIIDHMDGDASQFGVNRDAIVHGLKDHLQYLDDSMSFSELTERPGDRQLTELTIEALESINPADVLSQTSGVVYETTLMKGRDTDSYRWLPWRDKVSADDVAIVQGALQTELVQARERGDTFRAEQIQEAMRNIEPAIFRSESTGTESRVFPTGANMYMHLADALGGAMQASLFLDNVGIEGVKYQADAGRSTSYNYVVFNDSNIEIKRKRGLEPGKPLTDQVWSDVLGPIMEKYNIPGDIAPGETGQAVVDAILDQYGDQMTQAEFNTFAEYTDTLYQRQAGKAKGSISRADGEIVIKFMDSADPSTLLHEMAHLFRFTLTDAELAEANRVFKIGEDGWTRVEEEGFARKFEQWLGRGAPGTEAGANIFRAFRNWLLDVYGSVVKDLGGEMSSEQANFFADLFDSKVLEAETAPPGVREGMFGHIVDKLFDWLNIEHAFDRMGMPETGFQTKLYFGTQNVYINEAIDVDINTDRSVRMNPDRASDAVLMAEDATTMERIANTPEGQRTPTEQAALDIREYLDRSQIEYQARGIPADFKSRFMADLTAKLHDAEGTKDAEKYEAILQRMSEVDDVEYVHIPFNFWMKDLLEKDSDRARQLWDEISRKRSLDVGFRERNTLRIQDLIDAGIIKKNEVHYKDILASYGRQKGRDFAMSNILAAAKSEGAVIPKETRRMLDPEGDVSTRVTAPRGFKNPAPHMRVFKNYFVRDGLFHWVDSQLSVDLGRMGLGVWAKVLRGINITKMWAFHNPFFLPMYDVLQAHMAGAMNIMRPIETARKVAEAFDDVINFTERARVAEIYGKSSTPYNSPLTQIGESFDMANRVRHTRESSNTWKATSWMASRMEHALRDTWHKTFYSKDNPIHSMINQLGGVRPALRNAYELSWTTAWFLDGLIRQVTNNHFLEQGYTPREAAQTAAMTHGDYASVPPQTRKRLNALFFTPTFKIAMGNWLLNSIRAHGNIIEGDATLSQKQKAGVFIRTMAILTGFDMAMLALGLERDEFGRRYYRPIDTETGERELVINWTGPHNLFLKYMQRTFDAFGPEVPNPMLRVFQQNSWELTPMWRIAQALAFNRTPGNEKIWMISDSPHIKFAKGLHYAGVSAIGMLAQLAGEEDFGREGAEAFAREYGQMMELITSPFLFKYTRQPSELRFQQRLEMLLRLHEEEVEGQFLINEILRRGGDPKEVVRDYLEGKPPFRFSAEQRSRNLTRRMERLILEFEEEHYDPWAPEVRGLFDEEQD